MSQTCLRCPATCSLLYGSTSKCISSHTRTFTISACRRSCYTCCCIAACFVLSCVSHRGSGGKCCRFVQPASNCPALGDTDCLPFLCQLEMQLNLLHSPLTVDHVQSWLYAFLNLPCTESSRLQMTMSMELVCRQQLHNRLR